MVANWLSIITSAIAGGIEYVLGGLDSLIYALAVFVILDYISGVLMAIQQKKLSSKIGFSGIAKKTMIFVLVALGSTLDQYIFGSGQTIRTMIIIFYLTNEGISILENVTEMGLPIPEKLKNILLNLKSDGPVK